MSIIYTERTINGVRVATCDAGELDRLRADVEALATGLKEYDAALDRLSQPAHTYASENADHYRGFDAGVLRCREVFEALCRQALARVGR